MPEYNGKVQDIVVLHSEMKRQFADFRKEQLQSYEYIFGNMIDKNVREALRAKNRPELEYHLLLPQILWISGTLQTNKTRLKATPLGEGDEERAGLKTRIVSDYGIGNDGYKAIARSAVDAAIGKVGFTGQYIDFNDDPEGKWVVQAEDPIAFMWDWENKDWEKVRFYEKTGWYTASDIIKMYKKKLSPEMIQRIKDRAKDIEGKYSDTVRPKSWFERVRDGLVTMMSMKRQQYEPSGFMDDFVDAHGGMYRVIEFYDKRTVTKRWMYSPSTRQMQMVEEGTDEQALLAQYPDAMFDEVSGDQWWITVVAPGLMPEEPLLEMMNDIQGAGPMHKRISCYDFHPDGLKMTSIVDIGKTPQNSFNQRKMTLLEAMMDEVMPRRYYPKGAIDDDKMHIWQENKRGGLFEYVSKDLGKPEREQPNQTLERFARFGDDDQQLISWSTGINPNLAGFQQTANENGVVIGQRVQQGMVMTSYFFGQVQDSMRSIFRYCDRGLSKYLTVPKEVRLLSPEGDEEWVKINWNTIEGKLNDLSGAVYDYKADTTQLGTTAKQMKFYEALEFIKVIPGELVDYTALFDLWDSPVAPIMKKYASMIMQAKTGQLQTEQQIATANAKAEVLNKVVNAQTASQVPPMPAEAESSRGNARFAVH